jgi:hypothetical protein
MVSKLGLGRPQARTDVQNIRGRDRGALYFRLFFAEVRDRVVDSGRLDVATLDAASGLLDDPDYWTQCWMMTAVWARKPAGSCSSPAASRPTAAGARQRRSSPRANRGPR